MLKLSRAWRYIKRQGQDIVVLQASVNSIAVSFAVGTFIAIIPLFGMSVFLGVTLVVFFRNLNKLALFGAMAFWNPFVLIPVYWLSYQIGDYIFGTMPVLEFEVHLLNRIYFLSRRFLVGNFILALLLALISYFLIKIIITQCRKGEVTLKGLGIK